MKPRPQRYQQRDSTRWANYEEAKDYFSTLPVNVRKRIRRRASGHFDVVVYERLPEPEPVADV